MILIELDTFDALGYEFTERVAGIEDLRKGLMTMPTRFRVARKSPRENPKSVEFNLI
jgi:hypothetical protein